MTNVSSHTDICRPSNHRCVYTPSVGFLFFQEDNSSMIEDHWKEATVPIRIKFSLTPGKSQINVVFGMKEYVFGMKVFGSSS